MTITSLSQAKRDRERVNIFVDQEFAFAVDKNTLAKHMLFVGKELSISSGMEEIKQILAEDTVNYLYRRLLDLWFKKPRSSRDITQKIRELQQKRQERLEHKPTKFMAEVSDDEITAEVTKKLVAHGYDDLAFADWFAAERSRQAKYGKTRVVSELRSKGISADIAKEVTNKYFQNEEEQVVKLLQKKFGVGSVKEISDQKEKQKAYRYIISRGFSPV